MDIKSKASVIIDATLTAGEIFAAVYSVPGAVEAVLDAGQAGIAAAKGPSTATLASRDVVTDADGAVIARLVYEMVDQPSGSDAGQGAAQNQQQAAQDGAPPPVVPLSLTPLGLTPAAA